MYNADKTVVSNSIFEYVVDGRLIILSEGIESVFEILTINV